MILTYFLFVIGFIILILGAQAMVNGASGIGLKLKVPQMVMGLTVVALGTSLPELIVNVFASIQGSTNLAIGNVLGSNITNTLLVVGVAAIIIPIRIGKKSLTQDIPYSMAIVVILFLLGNDWIFGRPDRINRLDGVILILFLLVFLYSVFFKQEAEDPLLKEHLKPMGLGRAIIYVVLGSLGLYFGGKWIVDGALVIASAMGISETAMGLTLVSGATSLPELVTSIIAARKNNADMALGNAVGSNIMNILLVLGVSALIRPLPFPAHLNVELGLVFFASLLLVVFAKFGKAKNTLSRWEGILLVIFYVAFIYFSTQYQ